jgi:tripartite-type tricarboxylate transporter receptor subunit TctC
METRVKIRHILPAAAMAILASGAAQAQAQAQNQAAAQNYPSKQITVIVPFTSGGTTDVLARLVGAELSKSWGQPVIIENKPGAAANTGSAFVARSAPDGYTLLMGTVGTHAINPALYGAKMPFDHIKDFTPLSMVASVPNVLAVNAEWAERNKITDVKTLVGYLKANPGKVNCASSGAGTSIHLSCEMFKSKTKTEIVHVPYKGSAPAVTDLVAGNVELMFDNLPSSLGQIKAGKLKALAVTTAKPIAALPNVPTVAQSGGDLADFEAGSWFGLFVPAGTPAPIVAKLEQEVSRIVQQPQMREKILAQGAEPVGNKSADFAGYIKTETAKWAQVVKTSGARVD